PVPTGRLQRALGLGRRRSQRVGPSMFLSRADRQRPRHAASVDRRQEPARVSGIARRRNESCLPPLCLFAQSRVEERSMAPVEQALLDTRVAFDRVAPTYHRANQRNRTLCQMRERTVRLLEAYSPPGSRILDLGCGPGSDDADLALRGYHITAI